MYKDHYVLGINQHTLFLICVKFYEYILRKRLADCPSTGAQNLCLQSFSIFYVEGLIKWKYINVNQVFTKM